MTGFGRKAFVKCYSTVSSNKKLVYSSPSSGLVKLVKMFSLSTLSVRTSVDLISTIFTNPSF
jgi:hypothetical protein